MVKVNLAITYRCNVKKADRDKVNESTYDICFDKLKLHLVDVISKFFETDKQGRFHVHILALADTKVKYTFLKVPGFSSKCMRIWNLQGWNDYIRKDQKYAESTIKQLQEQLNGNLQDSRACDVNESDTTLLVSYDEPSTPKEGRLDSLPKKKLF